MHDKQHNKIVFAGPVGSGKTTAIGAISDIDPVRTEANASDDVALLKQNTTVAMDYGVLNLDGGEKLMLYGTPGQTRFSFMWDIVSKGAIGLVLLMDNRREDPVGDLKTFINAFGNLVVDTACVIGVSHCDAAPAPDLTQYREALGALALPRLPPVFQVDARSHDDVATLVKALLFVLDPEQAEV